MMNKVVVGGLLAAMMGGTPVATYFLTKGEESSTVSETPPKLEASDEHTSGDSDCQPNERKDNCPATRNSESDPASPGTVREEA